MGFLYRRLGVLPTLRRLETYSIIPFKTFPRCSLDYVLTKYTIRKFSYGFDERVRYATVLRNRGLSKRKNNLDVPCGADPHMR
jgi:hypothetical protein